MRAAIGRSRLSAPCYSLVPHTPARPREAHMPTPLRPMTLGELLDRIFFLYRTHFIVFAGIVALPNLGLLAVQLVMIVARDRGSVLGYMGLLLVLLVTGIVVGAVSQAATVIALSKVYLNRPVTIADAFSTIKGRIV